MVTGIERYNIRRLYQTYDCLVKIDKEKLSIITDDKEKLKILAQEAELILCQEGVSGPAKCYIHPQGIHSKALYIFKPYSGRIPVRTKRPNIKLYKICQELKNEEAAVDDIVEKLSATNPFTEDDTNDGVCQKLKQIHGDIKDDPEKLRWTQKIRVHPQPEQDIVKFLQVGLELLCQKRKKDQVITNLTARFGKIVWGNFKEDTYQKLYDAQKLTQLLFDKDSKHTNVFNTDVQAESAEALVSSMKSQKCYTLETYDVKVTTLEEVGGEKGVRLDIRLLVRRGDSHTTVKVIRVKKNETKDLTFDILQFHRKHDFRVCLQYYKCVDEREPLYKFVDDVVSQMTFSPHILKFQSNTKQWNIPFIRHKLITTYDVGRGFAITVAKVAEWNKDESPPVFDTTKDNHTEVELHNLAWECAFGRDGGLTPPQSLALYMEEGIDASEFDTTPYPWSPDIILKDLDAYYWSHIEKLIETLEGPHTK